MPLRYLLAALVTVFSSAPQVAVAAEEHSMTGCLARGDAKGSYVLKEVEGVGTVDIPQGMAALDAHVGHKIEITGTAIDGAAQDTHAMQVTAMKHIAASCP